MLDNSAGRVAGSKLHTSRINIIVILAAATASFNFGYSNNVIAGSLAQTSFIKYFLSGGNATTLIASMLAAYVPSQTGWSILTHAAATDSSREHGSDLSCRVPCLQNMDDVPATLLLHCWS